MAVGKGKIIDESAGQKLTMIAPSGGVTARKMTIISDLVGFPVSNEVAGALFTLQTKAIVRYAKQGADTPAIGAPLYYDSGADEVTTTAAANTKIGAAIKAADSGDTEVDLRLNEIAIPT